MWKLSLTGRNEFFLNPPRASLSATYFQRRPSNSSQQMIPTMGDGGGGASRRGVEAKLALIRIVSRTRISLLAMVVVVELADCFMFIFIGFGAMTEMRSIDPISQRRRSITNLIYRERKHIIDFIENRCDVALFFTSMLSPHQMQSHYQIYIFLLCTSNNIGAPSNTPILSV